MKILFVNKYNHLRSGTERYMFNLKRLLKSRGHRVELFCMAHPQNDPAPFDEYFVPNIDFHRVQPTEMVRLVNRVLWDRFAAHRIGHVLDLFSPDVVHLFNIYHHISPSILPPIKKRGIPILQTVNDYKLICPNYLLFTNGRPCLRCRNGRYANAVRHRCLHGSLRWSMLAAVEMLLHRIMSVYERHVSVFLAPSRFVLAKLHEFGVNPDQTRRLPYCIPGSGVERAPPHGKNRGYVLYFGRLSREKGLATLMAAMSHLSDLELWIAGDGPLRSHLERQTHTLGLSNIRFCGHCRGEHLNQLVAGARLSVLPSEWYEVFGQSVVESLLLSRPVVASRTGGIPEVMEDGEHGLLVPSGDASALADAMRWLASHAAVANEMGRAGREAALARFGVERHYEELSALYYRGSA
jgi:glycosyltransferase involved in cell wall biosynthesis